MNIYFSGIGGVGIGPLAEIALDAGHHIQGSDREASSITTQLQKRGASLHIGTQDGDFLQKCHTAQPIDWFVYTSALPVDHPELKRAQKLGIKTAKRSELLKHIIAEKNLKLIAVAGSHGKTTTSGMMVWTLQQLGIPVSYSVGTTLSFGPSGTYAPGSDYFVYECDEYDRNFLEYYPFLSLLTSVEHDHPDTYPTETDYIEAFRQFIGQSQHTIMWQADNTLIDATAKDGWILSHEDIMQLPLAGNHNRRNATLVAKAVEFLQLGTLEETTTALSSFPGTDRRFERLADNLYSDYAHHPAEIAATLQMARELNDHIVVVYQPHQNARQHVVMQQYADTFGLAEKLYWTPTYLTRENDPSLPVYQPNDFIATLENKQIAEPAELNDDLWEHVQKARQEGKLVLFMGAGPIDGWVRGRAASLSQNESSALRS